MSNFTAAFCIPTRRSGSSAVRSPAPAHIRQLDMLAFTAAFLTPARRTTSPRSIRRGASFALLVHSKSATSRDIWRVGLCPTVLACLKDHWRFQRGGLQVRPPYVAARASPWSSIHNPPGVAGRRIITCSRLVSSSLASRPLVNSIRRRRWALGRIRRVVSVPINRRYPRAIRELLGGDMMHAISIPTDASPLQKRVRVS